MCLEGYGGGRGNQHILYICRCSKFLEQNWSWGNQVQYRHLSERTIEGGGWGGGGGNTNSSAKLVPIFETRTFWIRTQKNSCYTSPFVFLYFCDLNVQEDENKFIHATAFGPKKMWWILKQCIKRLKTLVFTLSVSFVVDGYAASELSPSFCNLFCKVARQSRRSVTKEYIIRKVSLKIFAFSRVLGYGD